MSSLHQGPVYPYVSLCGRGAFDFKSTKWLLFGGVLSFPFLLNVLQGLVFGPCLSFHVLSLPSSACSRHLVSSYPDGCYRCKHCILAQGHGEAEDNAYLVSLLKKTNFPGQFPYSSRCALTLDRSAAQNCRRKEKMHYD